MEVVVTTGSGGLTVEGKQDRLTGISAQVDRIYFLTGNSDVVIDILRSGVIPLT